MDNIIASFFTRNREFGIVALVLLIAGGFGLVLPPYLADFVILTLWYAYLALCWNVIGGLGGQYSFGHGAFLGVTAYTSTILLLSYNISPWLGMLLGALFSVLLALVLGFISLRLQGFYFAMVTLALAQLLLSAFERIMPGGTDGLSLQGAGSGPLYYDFSTTGYYYIILVMVCLASLLLFAIRGSRFGLKLQAIRENEEAAESVGINAFKTKVLAFTLSGFLFSFAGTFYAQFQRYISPSVLMSYQVSFAVALVAIVGGISFPLGSLLGAFVYQGLRLVFLLLLSETSIPLGLIIFGVLVMIVAIKQPSGVLGLVTRKKRFRND